MGTMIPAGANTAPQGGVSPAFDKAANQATQALATMFKECHKTAPDSPECEALQNIIKAVAEIEKNVMSGGSEMESPAEDQAEGPMGEAVEGEAPMPPTSGNQGFAQAANDTQNMMQAAAKKRLPA